ncbi:MAG: peptidylprolyl isomerase [Thermogutta sp.]
MRQFIWPIIAIVLIGCGTLPFLAETPYRAGSLVYRFVRTLLEPPARSAQASESSSDDGEANLAASQYNGSWYGTRVPYLACERRLPEWPPRFEEAIDLVPSANQKFAENPAAVSANPFQPSGTRQLYPATNRPDLVWGTTPFTPILDPMEAVPIPFSHRPGTEEIKAAGVTNLYPGADCALLTPEGKNHNQPPLAAPGTEIDLVSRGEVEISDLPASKWPNDAAVQAAMAKIEQAPDLSPEICEQTTILARVGTDVILAEEIIGAVNEMLLPYRNKVPASVLEQYKQQLMRRLLWQRVEMKLVYQDAKRHLPPEAIEHFEKEVGKLFEEKELPDRLKKMGWNSPQEFDAHLKSLGSSLAHEKRAFIETVIAREWLRQQTKDERGPFVSVSPEELLAYYQAHIQEFEEPGWVEWQQLTIKKRPDRSDAEAHARATALREQVLTGEPFESVARAGSEGPTAQTGGLRERTYRGSLRSKALEEALFSLPVGTVSPIIEDEQGFHVVRVIRRQDARRVPFTEAQVQIREKLAQNRQKQLTAEWLQKLSKEIAVWTIYDSPNTPNGATN